MLPLRKFAAFVTVVAAIAAAMSPTSEAGAAGNADTIWIIYNHGSSGKDGAKDCRPILGLPTWAAQIDGKPLVVRMDGRERKLFIRVKWFCSDGLYDDFRFSKNRDRDCPGLPNVCSRAFLISEEIQRIAARPGVDRRLIFVAGQSAGGWAAMLIKAWDRNRFNGVIATSPNFLGSRHNRYCESKNCRSDGDTREQYSGQYVRSRHEEFLANMAYRADLTRPVLLFAMHCDAHNYPWEYPFARDYDGTLRDFPGNHRAARILLFPENLNFEVRIRRNNRSDNRICPPRENAKEPLFKERFHMGQKRFVCLKDETGQYRRGETYQYCGRKRIAYCSDNDPDRKYRSPTCSKTAHHGFYRGRSFADFARPRVLDFIRARIREWEPTGAARQHGYPCSFIKFERRANAKNCPVRVYLPSRPGKAPGTAAGR